MGRVILTELIVAYQGLRILFRITIITICILKAPKQVLCQAVKTQMKCSFIKAAFHHDLYCLLRLKQPAVTEIHHNKLLPLKQNI